MNFYQQTLLELIMALGAAMVVGNVIAIFKRKSDRLSARKELQRMPRPSRHQTATLAKHVEKQGTATLAVAPLTRSVVYLLIGVIVFIWGLASLVR